MRVTCGEGRTCRNLRDRRLRQILRARRSASCPPARAFLPHHHSAMQRCPFAGMVFAQPPPHLPAPRPWAKFARSSDFPHLARTFSMKSRRLSRGAALSARLARTRAEAEDLAATVNIKFERLPCGEGERPQMSQALIRATRGVCSPHERSDRCGALAQAGVDFVEGRRARAEILLGERVERSVHRV